MDYRTRLENEQQGWKDAKNGFRLLDGEYKLFVNDAVITEINGKMKLKFSTLVMDAGDYYGRKHVFSTPLEGKGIGLSYNAIKACGLDLDNIADLPDRIHELVKSELDVKLVSKTLENGNSYQNTNIIREQKQEEPAIDDIPFT